MSTAIATPITEGQKRDYANKGFFVLENVIAADDLRLLREEANWYMDQIHAEMDEKKTDVLGPNTRNSRYFVALKYKETGRLTPFLFSDLMADICRATIGPDAYLFHEQYVIKSAEKGGKFSWHQDSGYVAFPHREYVSCWCALDDMSEANGTVYMLPYDRAGVRTTVEHKVDAGSTDRIGYFGDDPGDPVLCPAGSIAVFSSNCFHRSGTNTTANMRRVYLAQYSPEPIVKPDGRVSNLADPLLRGGQRVV